MRESGRHFYEALAAWFALKTRSESVVNATAQIQREYADRPLLEVTEDSWVETFGRKRPGTYNRLTNIARAAMNVAERRGWIDRAPHFARREEPPPVERYLTAQEWARLRAELAPHLRHMADFAIATGLRWANVAGLEWERVDLRRKVAWIPARSAKAGRALTVPLNRTAIAALQATGKARTGFVFTYCGKPLESPKTGFAAACRRAGVEGVSWHDLRRTWASWHAMRGTPPDALQKLGGWSSRDMLDVYARLSPSYLASFAENARPVKARKRAA